MRYSITCPHCGSHYVKDFPHGGEERCRCSSCGATIRVKLPEQHKNNLPKAPSDSPRGRQTNLDRRLKRFFLFSALFIVAAIGCLVLVTLILKNC